MQIRPEPHSAVSSDQLDQLLIIARTSGQSNQGLKDYLLWADSSIVAAILVMPSGEAKSRLEGRLIEIKTIYKFLFCSDQEFHQSLSPRDKGTSRYSESTGTQRPQ